MNFFCLFLVIVIGKQICVADSLSRVLESQPNAWVDDQPSFIISLLIDDVFVV
jgi:hypothetical protein